MDMPNPPSGDRLALLYQLARNFNSSLDMDEVLNLVIDEVLVATRGERGFVMLFAQEGVLEFRVARGIEQQVIDHPEFEVSRSIIERVAELGQPILTNDAQSDLRFKTRSSVLLLGLRSILCVPLRQRDHILGVIYVDNRLQSGIFTLSDLELLNAIASNAAIAIENARLYQVAVEKGRLEKELQLARQVQVSMLPQNLPAVPGWEFIAHWLPARTVAGDYYDVFPLDANRYGLVIADVTDKGMPAALFMAQTRSTLRASVNGIQPPAEQIARINRLICSDTANGMFVTLFFAMLDIASGEMVYVNAGHNPPFLYTSREDRFYKLVRTGMLMGVDESATYEQYGIMLNPGDFLLLYTDGITEATDLQTREFGVERLMQALNQNRRMPLAEIVKELLNSLQRFTGTAPLLDDVTVLGVRRS
jgi:sigma-B regulation protein RsbU (phosphoserine phosphatase)